jgi:hypothetical protein
MNIEIAGRFRPFSHRSGTRFLLPKSSVGVQVFPALLVFNDLAKPFDGIFGKIALDIEGPVDEFTILQDLEKMQLRIWGHAKNGYFRYHIEFSADHGINIVIEKGTFQLSAILGRCDLFSQSYYRVPFKCLKVDGENSLERLSLGNHKAQNTCLMRSRIDFSEILPLWHSLGKVVPFPVSKSKVGTLSLLKACEQAVQQVSPESLLSHFRSLFLAGFDDWLSPRLIDTDFHGIVKDNGDDYLEESPLSLLSEGSRIIRSLFVHQHGEVIKLLPALPKELHCGRFTDIACGDWGMLSIEWSKKAIKKVILKALKTRRVSMISSKGEQSCRLRTGNKDKGMPYQLGLSVDIVAGQDYWFDNFMR